jgi:hypothetical protein
LSFVLAALKGSTYQRMYASPFHLLRPGRGTTRLGASGWVGVVADVLNSLRQASRLF